MSELTMDQIVERVEELMEGDLSFEAAVRGVHAEISTELDLRQFWDRLGAELLRKALGPRFRRKGPTNGHYRPTKPTKRPSWRQVFQENPDVVWEIELPVGMTGATKPIGEFTREDVQAVEDYYTGQIQVMTTRREYWTRIRRKMGSDDTIRSAYDAGRIRETDLGFAKRSREDLLISQVASEESG